MKYLIACDKFRGSLDGEGVNAALEQGIRKSDPSPEVNTSSLADGGEGSLKILAKELNAEILEIPASDALGRPIKCPVGWDEKNAIAIIEMAAIVGLGMLKSEDRNPMRTSTFGLGQAVKWANEQNAQEVILCIGGSATNDGGAGVLEALGFRFLDADGSLVYPNGGNLKEIIQISQPCDMLSNLKIKIACDVDNPLCGPNGAAFVYAKQKGASNEELPLLDDNLKHWGSLVGATTGNNVFEIAGYGAAGGVAVGLCEFLRAELVSGSQLFFDLLDLKKKINWADVVITGEGKIDYQSAHGKAISPIIEYASGAGKELQLVCGIFEPHQLDQMQNIPRHELVQLANELQLDSFANATEILHEIGNRLGTNR